jgi:hypothetical protein
MSTLPRYHVVGSQGAGRASLIPEYFRRSFSISQMDFEFTSWQMLFLILDPTRGN